MTNPVIRSHAALSRRRFLAVGAAAATVAPAVALARQGSETRVVGGSARARRAKNLIFVVSDGMSHGTIALANLFLRERFDRESRWTTWVRDERPARGLIDTASLDSPVTDSAAASSAWSIGRRVENSSLNVLPGGEAPEPLLVRAKRTGRLVGVATTTRVTHATPAGFLVNVPDRELEDDIAAQMLSRGADVVLGGGARHFGPGVMATAGTARVVRTRAELLSLGSGALDGGGRVVGLFADSHMAFEVERPEQQPSLAEMTAAALRLMGDAPGGFALQIEGGRVDHAAHWNDAGSLVFDQAAMDDALGVALDWIRGRDDTLLVATTDHGNANPGLQHYGAEATRAFSRVQGWKRSFEWVWQQVSLTPREERTGALLRNIVEHATGLRLSVAETRVLEPWVRGAPTELFEMRNNKGSPLAGALSNQVSVAFLGPNHTSDHVEAAATGPGSEMLPAFGHLTDVHAMVAAALNLPPAEMLRAPALMGERSKPD